ncbi:MAG: alpha/beta fold hydrolase [Chloroflexota bacterium]
MSTTSLPFHPSPLIRHNLSQTIFSVKKPRHVDWILSQEQPILLDAGEDVTGYNTSEPVRLLAYYTSAAGLKTSPDQVHPYHSNKSRGLVLMLHGWQGCSHSTYNLVTTDALIQAGYDVMRLNLRDHGPNLHLSAHRLNVGVFFGTLIQEAIVATQRIAEMTGERPFYIVGPSMGGNFALRLAIAHNQTPFHNLRHIVAISPAVDPASATDALDSKRIYRSYFRQRWLQSLREKIKYFPQYFNIMQGIEQFPTVREMTEWVIPQMTQYSSADEYFASYAVHPTDVPAIQIPTTIVTSRDDQVIPVKDIEDFPVNPALQVHILDYGGHVGFVDLFPFRHCLPEIILSVIAETPHPNSLPSV